MLFENFEVNENNELIEKFDGYKYVKNLINNKEKNFCVGDKKELNDLDIYISSTSQKEKNYFDFILNFRDKKIFMNTSDLEFSEKEPCRININSHEHGLIALFIFDGKRWSKKFHLLINFLN